MIFMLLGERKKVMDIDNKILVVEDELEIRNVLDLYLKKEGFTVLQTDNGNDAIKIADKEKPSLIILDIMLPGLSGYEVCKRLKSNNNTRNIIIVILSAKGQDWEKSVGYDVGADLYETKPFSPKKLMTRIKSIINTNQ